jgi:CRP-like cAMP-binding protein
VRAWTTEFRADALVRDRLRSRVYYALRRQRIAIPYPIQVQVSQEPGPPDAAPASALDGVAIFEPLSADQRARLVASARLVLYGAGEAIVREGEPGASMFVIVRGTVAVRLAAATGEVARIASGGYFGEMSLLTGEPRTATVVAESDCRLVEIDVAAFREVALADPVTLDQVSAAVARRRAELEQHREAHSAAVLAPEPPQSLLLRVRQFLRV